MNSTRSRKTGWRGIGFGPSTAPYGFNPQARPSAKYRKPLECRAQPRNAAGQVAARRAQELDETNRLFSSPKNATASPEDLAQQLCTRVEALFPTARAHAYLAALNPEGSFVAPRAGEIDCGLLPEHLSAVEVAELIPTPDDATVGTAGGEGHPFATLMARRMGIDRVHITPLLHEGQTIGLLLTGEAEVDGAATEISEALQATCRIAGLAIGSARLRLEISRLERARSDILSMVSHELRSPLHVILGYEGLLREGALGPLTDDQHDALVRIGRNASQLAGLIENTLTAGRENAERLPGGMREVRPCDIAGEILEEMASLYGDQDVELLWHVPEHLPRLYTEPDKLKIILPNLVSNALKFTDDGTVEVAAQSFEGGVAITVADTGVGIAADELSSIFEEFRQASGSDEGTRGGVGLGLYIVRRMIERLEGTISVQSVPGEGSTFTVWLPRRIGAVHAAA